MKYLIWGAGKIGSRYRQYIKNDDVIAFVDKNPDKVGTLYYGKPVISFEQYILEYRDYFVIPAILYEKRQVHELERLGIKNYLLFSECPGEYQEVDFHTYLWDYVRTIIRWDKEYIVYGCSLYAIQLSEMIYEVTGRYAQIVINKNFPFDRGEAFIKTIGNKIPVYKYSEKKLDADVILVACEDELPNLEKMADVDSLIINVFDCSEKIEAYHNKKIEKYKNCHNGESCFIVATGPSLAINDLETLKSGGIICISMNSIWRAFAITDWRPNYFMAEDKYFYEAMDDRPVLENPNTGIKMMFLGDTSDAYWKNNKPKDKYLIYHLQFELSEFRYPKFSNDMSRRTYAGGTVTYTCLQMAAYMGFKNIYLLGVDFTNTNVAHNVKYGHFYHEDVLVASCNEDAVMKGYESARKYADEHGIHIYNATRGGYLEIFDRVDFDSLFTDGKFTPEKAVIHPRKAWYKES